MLHARISSRKSNRVEPLPTLRPHSLSRHGRRPRAHALNCVQLRGAGGASPRCAAWGATACASRAPRRRRSATWMSHRRHSVAAVLSSNRDGMTHPRAGRSPVGRPPDGGHVGPQNISRNRCWRSHAVSDIDIMMHHLRRIDVSRLSHDEDAC